MNRACAGWSYIHDGSVYSLDVLLHLALNMNVQVLYQLHPFLEISYLALVVHVFGTSYLDYCNLYMICRGLPLKGFMSFKALWDSTI